MTPNIETLEQRHRAAIHEARKLSRELDTCTNEAQLSKLEAKISAKMAEADDIRFQIDDLEMQQVDVSKRSGGGERKANGGAALVSETGEPVRTLTHEQRFSDWAREQRESADPYPGLTIGGYLRAAALGTAKASEAEKRALSEGTDSAGGFTVPDILSSRLIDLMRNQLVVSRAGAVTVPLGSDTNYIAKVDSDPTPAWRSEEGAVAESDPTFTRITLTPRSLAVLVKVSEELFQDTVNLDSQLPLILSRAMAVELDRVALFGSGVAPEPTGVVNTSNVEEVAHNATLTNYSPFVSARKKIKLNNFDEPTAFIMNADAEGDLVDLRDGNAQPLMAPAAIARIPFWTTGNVPQGNEVSPENGTIIAGVWRHLLLGMRQEINVRVLRERYASTLQIGLLATLRADIAVEYPTAFCKITGVDASAT